MTIDRTEEERWREKQKRYRASNESDEDPLFEHRRGGGDGGNGTSGETQARLARLEADMEHVKNDMAKLDASASDIKKTLTSVQVDIAKGVGEINKGISTLAERTKHFPTRWDVLLMLFAFLTAVGVIVGLAVRFIPSIK